MTIKKFIYRVRFSYPVLKNTNIKNTILFMNRMMNNIFCIKWGDKYDDSYVEKLKEQCEKNCSVDFESSIVLLTTRFVIMISNFRHI